MVKKTAIVTGSSSGFGLLSCIELALKGFVVAATVRDTQKSEALLTLAKEKGVLDSIQIYQLDVTSEQSIQGFEVKLKSFPAIDVLVNNAGFAVGGFSEELAVDDYRRQFETNFFGVIAVTNAILPIMRSQGHGRIINISSISGKLGFPGLSAYTASKHALEGYSESLRLELKPLGIDVCLIEPGAYQTNVWSSVDTLEINPDSPYYPFMKSILTELETGKTSYGDPNEVAQLVVKIASAAKTPALRYPIGKGVKMNVLLKNTLPWRLLENVILKRISR
jgi:NAD(P)-dependent dehydrogenase (short-subunit alcohol dehydrogenase family)